MLRKRSRSYQKDQQMGQPISDVTPDSSFQSDVLGQKHKTNSFFNIPGLFVGLSPKSSESDSVKSPTSPLDFRIFSNLNNPFRSPKRSHGGHHKSWDCTKVGLGIIDSLDDDEKLSGKINRSSGSKSILFGPQMRIKTQNFRSRFDSFESPKSLPKNYGIFPHTHKIKSSNLQRGNSNVLFGIGENPFEPVKILSCSLDSAGSYMTSLTNPSTDPSSVNRTNPVSFPSQLSGGGQIFGKSSPPKLNPTPISNSSAQDILGSLSASEIELSEDYTCVKTYGPEPKTTHIFCDCILECHNNNSTNLPKNEEQNPPLPLTMLVTSSKIPTAYPSCDFLSFCYSCKKKLEGEDIYMYRGEKAFCSWDCRSQEILMEEVDNALNASRDCDELSETWHVH
ncbi:hypothetical protein RHGRI_020734 [Rhododendron griersonianum]|uniref:FLZ-type domain-containing protein n=1 Tax=Rhododendron griersonianum TaxID=479676 RepID=A0AAV6JHM9_9ERIC|nr:hypothetical protein RHGRI_020734 [Rhododendron griersonianum]